MPRDDYGNQIKTNRPNRQTKAKRRSSTTAFGRRSGYVPVRTGQRRGSSSASTQPFPDPPDTWLGSLPEWAIFWAHGPLGLREGLDFDYLFYYGDPGVIDVTEAAQFDFYEYDVHVAIEIQGIFWHYEFGGKRKLQADAERKVRAESVGVTLIYIDEDDALADPIHFLQLARSGVDRSRIARGF